MKRILYKILFVLPLSALVFSSCENWLEASSSSNIEADKLLETRDGFHDALTGIYMNMGEIDAYGGYMTWYCNDCAAYPLASGSNAILLLQRHEYSNSTIRPMIESIWSRCYNIIANINMLLRELEARRNVISNQDEYNIIKGELLGLRAYIHFDLLRIYGVAGWSEEDMSKLTVPYCREYSSRVTSQRSYTDTETLLLEDLNGAIEALGESDPLVMDASKKAEFESNYNLDGYWSNRQKHFNYYSALGLMARLYQWKGDTATAAGYAQRVIDGAEGSFVNWIDAEAVLTAQNDDQRDWTFSTEQLFMLEITNLSTYTTGVLFDISGLNGGISLLSSTVDDKLFVRYDQATGSQAGIEDLRGPSLRLRVGTMGYYDYKFYYSTSYSQNYRNLMPMMKLSEMYYIVAENHVRLDENAEALLMLDKVRAARGITDAYPSTVDASVELTREYYREFIGEGVLFYYLKHKRAVTSIEPTFDLSYDDLVYPYPIEEVNYGRLQEL